MKKIGDYTEEGAESWFERQSIAGLILKATGVVLVLALFFGVIGFAAGWFRTVTNVVSPANVTKQWEFAYTYDRSLEGIAQQWCSAKQVENAETNPDYRTQRVSERLAIELNYSRVEAIYDAQLANAFKAKYVKPSDVPNQAPLLTEKTQRLCPKVSN